MRYLLTLNNRTILKTWDCASDEDFIDALSIYFNLAVHSGRIRRFHNHVFYMGMYECEKGWVQPSVGYGIVEDRVSGTCSVSSPFVGELQWGPEGSWNHRRIK